MNGGIILTEALGSDSSMEGTLLKWKDNVSLLCLLKKGDKVEIDKSWGPVVIGKTFKIKEISACIGKCESGVIAELDDPRFEFIDVGWLKKVE